MQPTQRGNTNLEQNIQYVAVPVDQVPHLSYNDFRAGGSIHTGPARATFRVGSRRESRGRGYTRYQGENDAYSMGVAPMNIFDSVGAMHAHYPCYLTFTNNLCISQMACALVD